MPAKTIDQRIKDLEAKRDKRKKKEELQKQIKSAREALKKL